MSQQNPSEQIRTLKQFIEQKEYDNFEAYFEENDISEKTKNSILCFALQKYRTNYQMIDYIQILLDKGADPNSMFQSKSSIPGQRIEEKDNVSILMYACIYADIRLVAAIATKKNINLRDKNGKNAIFYVLTHPGDNHDVIGRLILNGIDVNCIGKIEVKEKIIENHSPLSLVASKNMFNSFKILLENDADPNYKVTPSGDSILHIAVRKNNVEMVKLLLDTNKIKLSCKNSNNKTALELAEELKADENIIKLIKDKIEEGNRQSDIITQELISEDKKKSTKKTNTTKNTKNFIVEGNNNSNNNSNNNISNSNNNSNNVENKEEGNKIIKNEKKVKKYNDKKIKIFEQYMNGKKHNLSNSLKINIPFNSAPSKNKNFQNFISLDINNDNRPTLTLDVCSPDFLNYKNDLVKKKNLTEQENLFLKQEINSLKQLNNDLIKSNNNKDNQIKEMDLKYQVTINELNKRISNLEKQRDNDIKKLDEYKREIEKKNKILEPFSPEKSILYLNKKFINFNYSHNFSQEKNNYVIKCLSKDLLDFETYVTHHIKKTTSIYEELLKNVQNAIISFVPDYEVKLYGSHATNLCLPRSDIDVVLIPKNAEKDNISLEAKQMLLSNLYEKLKYEPWVKESMLIKSANTPIIKLYSIEKFNNMPIDVSIQDENHFGLKCVDLVKSFLGKYESLKPLVLALKNLLKRANLNDPYKGGLSSYGLILMIVYFLQHQSAAGVDISPNDNNLGQLFYDFIHYYAIEFEFNKMMIYIKNNDKDSDDLKYQNTQHSQGLIIIDPLNPSNNVAKSCFQYLGIRMVFIISLKALLEDCECGCHYEDNSEEYNNLHIEHCFLKRIFNAVKRFI